MVTFLIWIDILGAFYWQRNIVSQVATKQINGDVLYPVFTLQRKFSVSTFVRLQMVWLGLVACRAGNPEQAIKLRSVNNTQTTLTIGSNRDFQRNLDLMAGPSHTFVSGPAVQRDTFCASTSIRNVPDAHA